MLVVVGANDDCVDGYNNISCPFELQLASWDMLKYTRSTLHPSDDDTAEWLDGMKVASEKLG